MPLHHSKPSPKNRQRLNGLLMVVLSGCLLAPATASHADDTPREGVGDHINDFLSDRRRVGSLSGSVIGGALTAHPAGPLVGSLIGFIIGKKSHQSELPDHYRRGPYIDPAHPRSLTPNNEQHVATLSLSAPGGLIQAEPIAPAAATPMEAQPTSVETWPSAPTTPVQVPPQPPLAMQPSMPMPPSMCGQPAYRGMPQCFYFAQ